MVASNIRSGVNTSNPHSVHEDTSAFSALSGGLLDQYKGSVVKEGYKTREGFISGAVHNPDQDNYNNVSSVQASASLHTGPSAFSGSGAPPSQEVLGCGKSAAGSIGTNIQHGAMNSNLNKHANATAPSSGALLNNQYGEGGSSHEECVKSKEKDYHGVSRSGASANKYEAVSEQFVPRSFRAPPRQTREPFRQPPVRAPPRQTREPFRQPPLRAPPRQTREPFRQPPLRAPPRQTREHFRQPPVRAPPAQTREPFRQPPLRAPPTQTREPFRQPPVRAPPAQTREHFRQPPVRAPPAQTREPFRQPPLRAPPTQTREPFRQPPLRAPPTNERFTNRCASRK
jgi:hypothetical protein